MGCLDMSFPCEALLAVNADGAKGGGVKILNYKSNYDCKTTPAGASFEDLVRMCYRDVDGEMAVGMVIDPQAGLNCSDYGDDGTFCVLGVLRVGFCIAEDDCLAMFFVER